MKRPLLICLTIICLLLCARCSKEKKMDAAALKMQDLIVNISNYAHSIDPDFIIIPQNGIELAYNETNTEMGINEAYVGAINGIGVEELFYNSERLDDDGRLAMLQDLRSRAKIMVADYVSDNAQWNDAIQLSRNEGFICFPRAASNYDYKEIPPVPVDENSDSIHTLSQAKNYLYLISTDNFGSRTDMINAIKATNFDLVIIDLYFNEELLSASEIAQLKVKANGGTRPVIAYINIGAAENWRYYWQDGWKLHKPDWLKKKYEGYADEIWVEFWNEEWQTIIYGNDASYMKKILDAGFDGAYLDNVEAYYFLYDK